ncbi:neither inactivation nor afterpotential protein C-like isoform X2 [Artemia franciscana]
MDKRNTAIGTPYWMAPEVIACDQKSEGGYDNRADVWSVGITAIELGDGNPPLSEVHPVRAMYQIMNNPPPLLKTWTEWSTEYNDFISECLVKNPEHRPVMMEVFEHPFIQQVPENEAQLKSELKILLEDANQNGTVSRTQEITMKAGYLKIDRKSQLQRIYLDDLCGIERPNDETVIDQLQHRFFSGYSYTYMGDVLISLNPHGEKRPLKEEDHMRYKSKARSDEAPHVLALADRAWQDMMHHKEQQNIVFTGETFSGKSYNFESTLEHLLFIGKSNQGVVQKLISASKIIDMFGNAATNFNENATRHIKYFEITFSKTGKVSGALIWSYMLEKWRVSNFILKNNSNFHIFYYFYFGLAKTSRLDKYYLEAEKDYNYLPTTNCTDADKYAESFIEFETLWKHFDFSKEETDFIYKTIAAILLLGEVDFDNGAIKNDGSKEVLGNVATLLEVDAKKLEWVLLNYCVIVQGEPIRNKQTLAESYASRDSLSRILYARAFEWLVNLINMKISVTRLVFGDPHAIGLLDLFGFECAETNSYEQLIINITNEQLAFHFNQSIFSWEMQDCKQEDIDSTGYTFFDNRPILDLLLMKPEGVLAFLDEECKATGDKSMFLGSLNQFLRSKYLEVKSDTEFTVAHYTGKVTYTTDDFIVKNRDFIPQEIIELLRFSGNAVISTVFKTKVTKTGHVTTAVTFQEKTLIRRFNTVSKGKFSQARQLLTQNQVLRHSLIEVLQRLVSGSCHYVRCIRPNSKASPDLFDREMVLHQVKAMGFLDTIKLRQRGFSCRINFKEFLRRYQFLAFDFDETVDVTPDNCRLLLIRLKIDGWAIGKTKVFLKYFAEEYLSRLYETQVKKIVKIQAMMRSYLARKRKSGSSVAVSKSALENKGRRRKSTDFSDNEAAIEIQRSFRGYQARKEYKPLIEKSHFGSATVEEEAVNIIQYYFRKWKKRSMFQQLMLYRQEKQQTLIYFCQQVHLYNQEACGNLRKFTSSIDLNVVQPVNRGTHKEAFKKIIPKVNKLPFGNKNLYFLDTAFMCANAFNKIKSEKKEVKERQRSLDWDEPMKQKDPFLKHSETNGYEKKSISKSPTGTSYNRFAGLSHQTKQVVSPISKPSIGQNKPIVQYSQYGGSREYSKLKTTRTDSSDEEKAERLSRPSHIQELQQRAATVSDTADAPFNFQAMLKKTNHSRASMKRQAPLAPQIPNHLPLQPRSHLLPGDSKEIQQKKKTLSPVRHEIAPGIVLEGTEEEL